MDDDTIGNNYYIKYGESSIVYNEDSENLYFRYFFESGVYQDYYLTALGTKTDWLSRKNRGQSSLTIEPSIKEVATSLLATIANGRTVEPSTADGTKVIGGKLIYTYGESQKFVAKNSGLTEQQGNVAEDPTVGWASSVTPAEVGQRINDFKASALATFANTFEWHTGLHLSVADMEAGYRYVELLDGSYVRARYGGYTDTPLEIHPDDWQLYQDAMERYYKGILYSALLPGLGKILPGLKNISWLKNKQVSNAVTKTEQVAVQGLSKAPGPKLAIEEAQFGQKIGKHAQDFGLNPGSPQNRQWLKDLITDIHANPNEIRQGPWRGLGEVMANGNRAEGTALFYRKGADVVVTDLEGNFVTILKDGVTQNLRFQNAEIIFGTPLE